jgi:hypothetical protein
MQVRVSKSRIGVQHPQQQSAIGHNYFDFMVFEHFLKDLLHLFVDIVGLFRLLVEHHIVDEEDLNDQRLTNLSKLL